MIEACSFQGHVLLVDDEAPILKFLTRLLEQRGYQVDAVLSGKDALVYLKQGNIDILATDLMMPEMNGIALIQHAKALYPDLPCMVMTGNGEVESAVLAMEAGAFNYLLKPIGMNSLDAVLKVGMEHVHLIAERKKVEKENASLSSAVEHASEAVVICGVGCEISYINPAFARLLQYSIGDLEARSFFTLCMAGQEDTLLMMREHIASQEVWKGDVSLQGRDGQSILTACSVAPFHSDHDKHHGSVIMVRDVREERVMRKALAQKERSESLAVLASGIAHDFNNLLTSIIGHADLLGMEVPNKPMVHQHIHKIRQAGQSAAELCQLLLAYAGKGQYVLQDVDLSHAVKEAVHLFSLSVPRSVRVHMKLAPDLMHIQADLTQVQQLVMGVLTNALEAIGEKNGEISIETGQLFVAQHALAEWRFGEAAQAGSFVFVRISDTGCGMDEATIHKVFDPFFSTKFVGRGLGLSAVAGVVEAAKGLLELDSVPDEGTSLTLAFPVSVIDIPSVVDRMMPSETPLEVAGTVLVVDDDEDIVDVISASLEDLGYQTLTALDGADAIRIYKENQHAIVGVLMDMTMPNMNGDEAFLEMVDINPEVQVILSSGYTKSEIMLKGCFAASVPAGFLQKPYSIRELQDYVQKILQL